MQRLNLLHGPGGHPGRCASLTEAHRSYTITVAAIKRHRGDVLVNASLAGGPKHIVRSFCHVSESTDVVIACEEAAGELRRAVNQLLAYDPRRLLR